MTTTAHVNQDLVAKTVRWITALQNLAKTLVAVLECQETLDVIVLLDFLVKLALKILMTVNLILA